MNISGRTKMNYYEFQEKNSYMKPEKMVRRETKIEGGRRNNMIIYGNRVKTGIKGGREDFRRNNKKDGQKMNKREGE